MRSSFGITLIVTVLFAGGFFYYQAQAICKVPLEYRIGALDDRFGLSFEDARLAAADAEAAWEDATERNLFTYSETADLSINFIFDERQALADAEDVFKERLDATEQVSEEIKHTYDELVARYDELEDQYETDVAAYEARLRAYNEMVEKYNDAGGAPPEAYEELEAEQRYLSDEQVRLNRIVRQLNELVEQINQIGNRGNQVIETYNRGVNSFNQTFGEAREFTQGDYTGEAINIYTFKNGEELRLVLAHEFGHALSLDHVGDTAGVMHYLLGGQNGYEVTQADREAFMAICGLSTWERMKQQIRELLAWQEDIQ